MESSIDVIPITRDQADVTGDSDVRYAAELHQEYQSTWDVQVLQQAIRLYRSAIDTLSGQRTPSNRTRALSSSLTHSPLSPKGAAADLESSAGDNALKRCQLQLAAALGDLVEHNPDDIATIDEMIQICHDGLQDMLTSHPLFNTLQYWLGVALCRRYEATAVVSDIEEAVAAQRSARRYYVHGPITQYTILCELCHSLTRSFQQCGSRSDLAEAAALARQALSAAPEHHPQRYLFLLRLAYVSIISFMANGKLEELREAGVVAESAIELCLHGHRDRHKALGIAATASGVLYEHSNNLADIERAIEYLSEAVHSFPVSYGNNLALALQRRFSRKGDVSDLERSIQIARRAIQDSLPTHRFRDYLISNLSFSLRHLFLLRGDPAILEEAIQLQRQGIEKCAPGEPQRFVPVDNLAKLLLLRFRQNLNLEDLYEAVRLWREALTLQPPGRPNHGAALCQLAEGLIILFEEKREVKHLHEAISLHHKLREDGNPNDHRQSDFLFAAGKAYYTRFRCSLHYIDLEASIQQHRASLALRPVGHPERHRSLHELASALRTRYELASEPNLSDIEEATSFQEDALELLPEAHPDRALLQCGLARMFATYGSPLYSVTAAMEAVTDALMDEHSSAQARIGEASDVLEILDERVSRYPTRFHPSHRRLLEVHVLAIRLLPSIANFGLDIRARLRLLYQAEQTASRAARISLSLDDCDTAIEILESGRAVFWAQYLRLRTQFDDLPHDLSQELSTVANQLEAGSDSRALMTGGPGKPSSDALLEEQATKRRLLGEQFEALVHQARSLPGYDRYLLPPSFTTLSQAADGGIIVVLIPGETKSHAVIMRNEQSRPVVTSLTLPVTTDRLLELSDVLQNANVHQRKTLRRKTRKIMTTQRRITMTGPRNLLSELWDAVVFPVFQELRLKVCPIPVLIESTFTMIKRKIGRQRARLWWCSTGVFAFLPIHAAGASYGSTDCTSSYVVSSYTPTLSALLSARQKAHAIRKADIRMLLAGVPHPCEGEQLQEVVNETRMIKATVPPKNLIPLPPDADCSINPSASASAHDVISRLPEATFLHLACHGRQDPENALDSGFAMRDRMMTVAELMSVKLRHAFLAFLSACDTARGDEQQPDQALHLAAAMFFVGFPSIVGTMW